MWPWHETYISSLTGGLEENEGWVDGRVGWERCERRSHMASTLLARSECLSERAAMASSRRSVVVRRVPCSAMGGRSDQLICTGRRRREMDGNTVTNELWFFDSRSRASLLTRFLWNTSLSLFSYSQAFIQRVYVGYKELTILTASTVCNYLC